MSVYFCKTLAINDYSLSFSLLTEFTDSLGQLCPSLFRVNATDGSTKGSALSNDQDLLLGTGNSGIDQRTHQHNRVGTLEVDDHALIL